MNFTTQKSTSDASVMKRQLDHYVYLCIRKIWFILPVAALVTIVWVFVMSKTGLGIPELDSQAVLQFDNPDNFSAIDERVGLNSDSKAALLKSRSFLEQIVSKLSLQFHLARYPRSAVVDSLRIAPDAQVGNYELALTGTKYVLLFSNKLRKIDRRPIYENDVTKGSLEMPGIYLTWTKEYIAQPHNIAFEIVRPRDAVDLIIEKMSLKTTTLNGNIMLVTLRGRDYELTTQTLNTIVKDFVEENSSTKRSRKGEVLAILEKQLEAAREEMSKAEMELRSFRDANPALGLPDASSTPAAITDLEISEADFRAAQLQANSLRERYESQRGSGQLSVLSEIISFLIRYQTGTALGLQTDYITLSSESRRYEVEYSAGHPLAIANQNAIRDLGVRSISALNTLISDLDRKVRESKNRINRIQNQIARLPSKELRYSSLQRKYNINSEIYSVVLTRYNESRIALAVEIGDVYIVDYAVTPEKKSAMVYVMLTLGTGLILGLVLGMGPVVTIDYFDGSARTERDLRRLTDLVVLESIPIKGSWAGNSRREKGAIDEKLVSADYSHDFVDERYRQLRTKILLSLYEEKKKRIIISSLNMSEGKSLTAANLAITMAQQKISTVLIDGDLRRGIQHDLFGLIKKPGLSNLLTQTDSLTSAHIQSLLQKTHIPLLSLLSSGSAAQNSAELINSSRFRDIIDLLGASFDIIILDTPPVAVITDAIGVQDAFHKYLFVVRASQTNISQLNSKLREFPGLRRKVLGVVFNGAPYRRPEYYQYTSYK